MELIKYQAAKLAIFNALSVDEVKQIKDANEAMRAYAKQTGDYELANQCAEIRIRAERRLGEMLIEQKDNGGMNTGKLNEGYKTPPSHDASAENKPKLSDMGISHDMSSRAQKMAKIPHEEFENVINGFKNQQIELTSNAIRQLTSKPHVSNNTGENEWYTPICFIESARSAMGSIDLDPASSNFANKTVNAKEYWTIENDGLKKNWYGNVWLNPPYAQNLISLFITKLLETSDIKQYCVLVNNATETKWFQELLVQSDRVCFVKGRIKFIDKNGKQSGSPLQGQAIFYAGSRVDQFTKEFNQFGEVL